VIISNLLEVVGLLLAEGADTKVPCGVNLDTIPLDLVASTLRWLIELYGGFTA
jgi:hypothetical protein